MNQVKTHIGEVKSHTDIGYNEAADKAPRVVVDGEATPNIIFDEADPSVGGLRTWPQIWSTTPTQPDTITLVTSVALKRPFKRLKGTCLTP